MVLNSVKTDSNDSQQQSLMASRNWITVFDLNKSLYANLSSKDVSLPLQPKYIFGESVLLERCTLPLRLILQALASTAWGAGCYIFGRYMGVYDGTISAPYSRNLHDIKARSLVLQSLYLSVYLAAVSSKD